MDHVFDVTQVDGKIDDIEFSHRFIALNNFSILCDESGKAQKDILDDGLILLFSLSS
jgi:hypothetical protein